MGRQAPSSRDSLLPPLPSVPESFRGHCASIPSESTEHCVPLRYLLLLTTRSIIWAFEFFFSFYLWQSLLLFIFYLFTFDKVYCFICLIVAWFPYWSEAFTLSLQSQCSYFLSSSLLRPACPQSLFTCTQMFGDHSVIPFAVETGGIDLGILLARQSWPRAPCHLGLC